MKAKLLCDKNRFKKNDKVIVEEIWKYTGVARITNGLGEFDFVKIKELKFLKEI